jgi:aminoglycoside phosphotransferase (APT) family kinase protein
MDPAGLPALVEAIRHLHGVDATWVESVPVREEYQGRVVWHGEVQVFAIDHPKANRAYAWTHETQPGKRRFHVVLGGAPVAGPEDAVREATARDFRRTQN